MRISKPFLIIAIVFGVLIIGPILTVLTGVELFGLAWDFAGQNIQKNKPPKSYEFIDWRWATVDKHGHLVFWGPECNALSGYHDGFATYSEGSYSPISLQYKPNGSPLYESSGGFIDRHGKKIPLKMWHMTSYSIMSQGVAPVLDPYTRKYCYVDVTGKQRIANSFVNASPFSNGLAAVAVSFENKGTKKLEKLAWGYIDKTGKFVIPPIFSKAGTFVSERAVVSPLEDEKRTIVIDKRGKKVFDNGTSLLSDYSKDGFAIPLKGQQETQTEFGLVDKAGRTVSRAIRFLCFSEGIGAVYSSNRAGIEFVDQQGKLLIQDVFLSSNNSFPVFGDGLVAVAKSGLNTGIKYSSPVPNMFFIDRRGLKLKTDQGARMITSAFPFNDGFSVVSTSIPKPVP